MKPKTTSKRHLGTIAVLLGIAVTFVGIILSNMNNVFAQITGQPLGTNSAYAAPNPHQTQPPRSYPAVNYPAPHNTTPQPIINPQPNRAPVNHTTANPATTPNYTQPNAVYPANTNNQQLSLEQARSISTQKLYNARRAVAARDIVQAERLISEVQGLNLQYQPTEDRPEAIAALIRQHHSLDELVRTNGQTEQFRRNYAIFLLSQASALLNYGDTELATTLHNAAVAQNVLYNETDNKNGISPQAIAKRIADVKNYRSSISAQNQNNNNALPKAQQQLSITTQRQLSDAILLLKNAREAINNGDLERARNLCANVQQKQLPDSLFPPDVDSPTKLLGEIAMKSQSVRHAYPPANTNNIPNNTTPTPINVTNNVNTPASYPHNNNRDLTNAVYNASVDKTQTLHATSLPEINTSDFVSQAKQARDLALQQLGMEIIRMISEAQRLTNEHKHNEAIELLNKARQRVDEAQIEEATKLTFYGSIENALQTTHKHVDQNRPKIELDARNQEVWNKLKNESEAARSREEQIKTYVDECARLNAEQEYDQAILIAKRARDFAPNEPVTQLLLQHTQMLANVHRSEQNIEQKRETFLEVLYGVDETGILSRGLLDRNIEYARNWANIKNRRSTSDLYDRSESEKQIIRKLEMPISFSTDRPIAFREFIELLRAQTGVNIDVDWNELGDAYITSDSPVSLKLSNEIKLKNVLNQVLGQRGLAYVVKNEILNITTVRKARGQFITKYYYVGDLVMPMQDFDGSSPHDMINTIERSMRNQQNYNNTNHKWNPAIPLSINTPMNMPNNGYAVNPTLTPSMIQAQIGTGTLGGNTATLPNGMATDLDAQNGAAGGGGADYEMIINLIKNTTAWNDSQEGANIIEFPPSMSIVVRQTEEIHAEIVELLAQLRKLSDLQIAVEVRYITISDDYYEKMGVDFQAKIRNDGASDKIVLYGDNSSGNNNNNNDDSTTNNNNNNSSNSSSLSGIARGNNVTVGLQGPSQFQFDLSIPISTNTYGLADPMYGGFNPDSGLRMGFALLSDIEAYFFMNATQGDSRSNVLQAPKVMIFNGQMGSVVDSTQSPFVTSVVPVVGDFAIGYQPIIAVLNDGQIMTVRGTVSPNRQYVRLTMNPRFNTITKVSTFRYVGDENTTDSTTSSSGSEASDGTAISDERRGTTKTSTRAASGVTIQQPIMASFSVQTTVSVPDGGTILMGGIKRLREGRIESGTPILDKIPFIQRLFMNTAIGRDTSSILMVVTPRIIIQEEEEEFTTGIRQQ
ncbi:MAG: hypothetical protein LBH59_11635 [Planctomycetaceae bacterium]|nr:hypothetical protein [Planctomycetaceae bacterium]